MAKNFSVQVWPSDKEVRAQDDVIVSAHVIIKTMLEATSVACNNLSKDRQVSMFRTDEPVTHRTSAAAQAFIDVELFQLEG